MHWCDVGMDILVCTGPRWGALFLQVFFLGGTSGVDMAKYRGVHTQGRRAN